MKLEIQKTDYIIITIIILVSSAVGIAAYVFSIPVSELNSICHNAGYDQVRIDDDSSRIINGVTYRLCEKMESVNGSYIYSTGWVKQD